MRCSLPAVARVSKPSESRTLKSAATAFALVALFLAVAAASAFAAAASASPSAQTQQEQPVLSLLVPSVPVVAGTTITVNLVALNPVDYEVGFDAPTTLQAQLSGRNNSHAVTLKIEPKDERGLDTIGPRGFVSYSYELAIPLDAAGSQILTLRDPAPARAILDVIAADGAQTPSAAHASEVAAAAPLDGLPPPPAVTKVKRSFLSNFATYEPIYFIYGPDAPVAKFQFSFMYRILADEGYLAKNFPLLKGLSFAYTQRSLWDITGESSPFYDTSYMPELFCVYLPGAETTKGGGFNWLGIQAGFAHESNGRDGAASRSMNKLNARASVAFGNLDGWRVILSSRVWAYVGDMSDNLDLNDYRGYMDFSASLGKNDNLNLSIYLRAGQSFKYGSVQADLTYPLDVVFKNFAGYFLVQYWNGYGESLLNYNRRTETIRFGISLVR